MVRLTILILCIILLWYCGADGSIHICSNAGVILSNDVKISVRGNWINNGNMFAANSTVVFKGTTNDTIVNFLGETFNNLVIDKLEGKLVLKNSIMILDTLTFINGNLITDSCTVILADSAGLTNEGDGRYLVGNLTTTRTILAGTSTFGGIGVVVNTGSDIGEVTTTRISGSAGAVHSLDYSGINRFWRLTSSSTFDGNLTLLWVSNDDNGKDTTNLWIWHSPDNGLSWLAIGDSLNVSDSNPRSVELNGVTELGDFTVSDGNNPLTVWHDFNGDRRINVLDVQRIISALSSDDLGIYDLNGDQVINMQDVKLVVDQWDKLSVPLSISKKSRFIRAVKQMEKP